MKKLNISIGILSWGALNTLFNTLKSYQRNGLLDIVQETTVFFQETTRQDTDMAEYFNVKYIESPDNVGIGKAFSILAENAISDNILFLENDWVLIEEKEKVYDELSKGLYLLENDVNVVKYRHRKTPGDPLYTRQYEGREMDLPTHLGDCLHWKNNPDVDFPSYIKRDSRTGFFIIPSSNCCFTNNPTMYKTKFYTDTISSFAGTGIALEGNIQNWWEQQPFFLGHGDGLFKHYRIDR